MRRWSRINLSSRTKLILLAVVALMLPTTILSIIQYRSLVDLEGKTKVAVQDNMRQTLQTVTHKVEDNLKSLDITFAPDQLRRLDDVSVVPRGFPHDLLEEGMSRTIAFGGMRDRIKA